MRLRAAIGAARRARVRRRTSRVRRARGRRRGAPCVESIRRTSSAHSSPSTTSVARATSRAGSPAPSPPWATRPGKAQAAPSGVSASIETASASCVGTRPPHSSDAKKTPTGTTTTSSARAKRPDSSRERRSRRNSAVSAMQTRASSTQVATPSTTPMARRGPRHAVLDPDDRCAHRHRDQRERGNAQKARERQHARRAARWADRAR